MRIVIDLQGAQSSSSRNRGIGRYTNALALAIAQLAQHRHELILALNGQFDAAVEEVKARFAGLVEPANFRLWHPPAHGQVSSAGGKRATEKLYEAYLASLAPDVVLIASLFEGLSDAAVTSIGAFARMRTATVLYDLIPLINAKPYLDNPVVREWYLRKIAALRRADMWFAISESSRQEGIRYLGLDPARCINASTAADPQFRLDPVTPSREQELRQRYGLLRAFVMYTGGIDLRKNIEGLIRAFALLPASLRGGHQLAIVCSARPEDKQKLLELVRSLPLAEDEVVVTGFVPDEDLVALYNLCRLFVFPSWHEGFGLPALEAMNCGAVVIGADTSSVPEVIGRSDALFDPHDTRAMAAKIEQGLTDEAFRESLRAHAAEQAKQFSWRLSAQRALAGLERMFDDVPIEARPASRRGVRPRMAYVSPLPPERSGIASYSAELIPFLAQYYDIELINDLEAVEDPILAANFPIRSVAWFREHAQSLDRVLYHFGNSEFHQHMFDLLGEIPGTVVLHDFYLSGLQSYLEETGKDRLAWVRALYASHGYPPLAERFATKGAAHVLFNYPANFDVLAQAQGVIVHSQHSVDLARQWFPRDVSQDWVLIPHLRALKQEDPHARLRIRETLGLPPGDFVVCSFGIVGPTKLSLRLINTWLASPLSKSPRCHLVFVGQNDAGPYGKEVAQALAGTTNIRITGWASTELFDQYLAAADVAVQLRTQSRGETSGTVLDAMSHGLPTIVNASGSMADLPEQAVWKLPESFTDAQLLDALVTLWTEPQARAERALGARELIGTKHAPAACARRYYDAIEDSAARAIGARNGLTNTIRADWRAPGDASVAADAPAVAQAIADSLPPLAPARQLFVDVSELVQRDASTGIQRVVKGLLRQLLADAPPGCRVEPVYATQGEHGYRYAREFTLQFLGCPRSMLVDLPVDARAGDVFIGVDLEPRVVLAQRAFYRQLRQRGVRVEFVVYDLLPILMPSRFMQGAEELHAQWLGVVAENDGALCISQAVADELRAWIASDPRAGQVNADFAIRAFHLGVDPPAAAEAGPNAAAAAKLQTAIADRRTFLLVGTLEPRKGHALVLDAFDRLWSSGQDVNLVLVGRQGWMMDALAKRLKQHPRLGKQLFWIERADDRQVDQLYATASCLIAASEGEGFGLPLIEAAQRGLGVLARDIPVFREVGGEGAQYFAGDADSLAQAAREWLKHRKPSTIPHQSWQESAQEFIRALMTKR